MTGSQADSFLTPRVEAQVKMTALFPLDKVDVNVNSVAAFLSPDSRTTMQSALWKELDLQPYHEAATSAEAKTQCYV